MVRAFEVVEMDITLVDFQRAEQIYRTFDQLTFVCEFAVIVFDKRIFPKGHRDDVVGSLWWTDTWFDSETL
jgi:hypothetical protein